MTDLPDTNHDHTTVVSSSDWLPLPDLLATIGRLIGTILEAIQ